MIDPFEDHCWKDVVPDETLKLYESYRRKLFIGQKPAIVAVDLYDMAYQGGARPISEIVRAYPASCGINAWDAIEPTRRVFAAARGAGIPLFHTTADCRPNARPTTITATNRRISEADLQLFAFREEFAPSADEVVIQKQRASGFFGTPLASHLVQLKVDTVIVLGQTTSGCVRATTVDGFSHGFHMVLAEECCFDRSEISHQVNLFDLHHKYADLLKAREIIAHLGTLSSATSSPRP